MRGNFTYARNGTVTKLLPNDTAVSCQLPIRFEPTSLLSD